MQESLPFCGIWLLAPGPKGVSMNYSPEKQLAKEIVLSMIENKLFSPPPANQQVQGEALNAYFVAEINKAFNAILENVKK